MAAEKAIESELHQLRQDAKASRTKRSAKSTGAKRPKKKKPAKEEQPEAPDTSQDIKAQLEELKAAVDDIAGDADKIIKERPLVAVGVAFVVGMLVGRMVSR